MEQIKMLRLSVSFIDRAPAAQLIVFHKGLCAERVLMLEMRIERTQRRELEIELVKEPRTGIQMS